MKKYEEIMHRIMDLIMLETLKMGDRLPSIRSMATQMNVSTMTVLDGYLRLENSGLIESRPQSGFYVSPKASYCAHQSPNKMTMMPDTNYAQIEPINKPDIVPEIDQQFAPHFMQNAVFPFGSPQSDPHYFPNKALSYHLARVAHTQPMLINNYDNHNDSEELLDMILKQMNEQKLVAHKSEILITNGGTQAIMLALRALTRPGDTVALESPGYPGFYYLLNFFMLKVLEIPSDPLNGLDVNNLKLVLESGARPACLLLSSNFSNPTGALMPDDQKEILVNLCSRFNLPIIEDDTFGEIYFTSSRPRPLKAFAPSNVIYVGSFSKILAPGFKVGWLAAGPYSAEIQRITLSSTPLAVQLTIASFLKDGGMKRHLRQLRKQYNENIRIFRNRVSRYFPEGTQTSNPQGGQYLWIELPENYDSVALFSAAISKGISFIPGIVFSSSHKYLNSLRLNCSAVKWNDNVDKAIKDLGQLAASTAQ